MDSHHRRSSCLPILLLMGAAVVAAYADRRYVAPRSSDWSYEEGENGPEHWADHYPECGGSRQSPINIEEWTALGDKPWTPFKFSSYDSIPDSMTITNNGHSAQVSSDLLAVIDGGGLGGEYIFTQFHFHWGSNDFTGGSEHTIDWVRSTSELHLVHYKREYGSLDEALKYPDGVVVLGVLLDLSQTDNNNLDKVVKGLASVREPGSTANIATFALRDLLPHNIGEFYRYEGSLSTPGCAEAVIWTVFKHPITVSSAQMDEFRKLLFPNGQPMMDNFRPTQPLNGRKVYKGEVDDSL